MSGPTRWRNLIEVHPAAGLFPLMAKSELKELAADIQANGQRVGVTLWTPDRLEDLLARRGRKRLGTPQKVYLLDGRNRLTALEMAYEDEVADTAHDGASIDDEQGVDQVILAALDTDPYHHEPNSATLLYGDVDPYAYIVSANIRRRHLTAEQKREIIAELLKANPERSDRATAKIANLDHKTVAAVRAEVEGTGEIPQLKKTIGADGKARPARKIASARAAASSTPPSHARDKAVAGFSQLLHQQLATTLDDLTRLPKGEGERIREMPRDKRISLAHAYLDALGIGLDDLGGGRGA